MTLFPAVILAGGRATRLGALTQSVPKALMELNGEPFIIHQLRLLAGKGIRDAVLCVGHLGEQIQQRVGDGRDLGLEIRYVFDGPRLLGTAGAIKQALSTSKPVTNRSDLYSLGVVLYTMLTGRTPLVSLVDLLAGNAFFVLYGDSYLDCDYAAVQAAFQSSGKLALMTVFRNDGRWDTSNVEFADGRILAYDKKRPTPRMHHIDYGLGVFRKEAFAKIPAGEPSDLSALCQELLARDQLAAFEVFQRFYEIGSPAGLEETQRHLVQRSKSKAI